MASLLVRSAPMRSSTVAYSCLLHDQIARQTIHSFQSAASDCATPPELCAVLEELLSEGFLRARLSFG